ncbi:MAG: hypothetical protein VX613_04065 [Candidatus Thermoplasmatota archaeon]|nr:hypothetical protein [Candidatus Thermoplasmatota archaeon]
MLESETLPKKFAIPIIFLIISALLIPIGNVVNNSEENVTEEEKWNQTVVIAVFTLSFALAGIIIFVIISNPSILSEEDKNEDTISFVEREQNNQHKK